MLALFMIVILAAIAVYLLTISTGQGFAAAQDEQSTSAYQAARSGLDWAAYRLLHDNSCASPTLTFPATVPALKDFQAVVSCQAVGTETDGATTLTVYKIVVTACNAGTCTPTPGMPANSTYVERELQLTITK